MAVTGIQDLFCNSGHIDRSGAEEYGSEDGRKRDKKVVHYPRKVRIGCCPGPIAIMDMVEGVRYGDGQWLARACISVS